MNVDHIVLTNQQPQTANRTARLTKDILLKKSYLLFPIRTGARQIRVDLEIDGQNVREFDAELAGTEEEATFPDLAALGVDLSNGQGIDLKAVSKRAAQLAEKRVIERVLRQTRWNRKEAAGRLQISYKALLYKMKENGLSEGR